jgi:TonB family protein
MKANLPTKRRSSGTVAAALTMMLTAGLLVWSSGQNSHAQEPNRQLVQPGSANTSTGKRLALVIGNSAYPNAPLKNPVNDAQDIAAALRALGFEVISRENVNQNEMKRAIREFGEKIRGAAVGLFYYAGHGVQVKGENYLVPVDAKVESEQEVEYECVKAGFVLAQMDAARDSMNIVILDACRNNPFVRSFRSESKGLAQMDAPSGTLIAYATAPGSVASDGAGRNGLYTQELLKQMRTSGLGIEDVFKRVRISVRAATQQRQTPWESSSLVGDFYFTPKGAGTAESATGSKVDSAAFELSYWESIKNSTDPDDFKAYLEKYPSGQFAALAQNKIRNLPTAPKVTEPGTVGPRDSQPQNKVTSGGVLNDKAVKLVEPAYPAAARAVRASGDVRVQVLVDENGNVISAEAISGNVLLRQAAVTAARESKFSPVKISGAPVKVSGIIVYNFVPK